MSATDNLELFLFLRFPQILAHASLGTTILKLYSSAWTKITKNSAISWQNVIRFWLQKLPQNTVQKRSEKANRIKKIVPPYTATHIIFAIEGLCILAPIYVTIGSLPVWTPTNF